jgi:hypothetical protein
MTKENSAKKIYGPWPLRQTIFLKIKKTKIPYFSAGWKIPKKLRN